MGLIFAKYYLKNTEATNELPMHYKGSIHKLKMNERFFFPDDDYVEVTFTGNEIKIIHGNEDYIETSLVNGRLTFRIVENIKDSYDRKTLLYPLPHGYSSIYIEIYRD